MSDDGVAGLLAAAVAGIGGAERPGQVTMAQAVARAISGGEHLAVQAGTGTGKSLAYLVPAVRHAVAESAAVVVSTATIALQRQLIDRDLPRLAAALRPSLGREPTFAILKGRGNYLCLLRTKGGFPEEPGEALFDPAAISATGKQVRRLHEWAAITTTGDRDELVPGVPEAAWRQVSISARECLGQQRCPFGSACFAELARDAAGRADVVVTNHALLAIHALGDYPVLPEHDVVIVDEAHELVDRVTSVASGDLSAPAVAAAHRRCGKLVSESALARLQEAGQGLERAVAGVMAGRLDVLPAEVAAGLVAVRDAAGGCATQVRTGAKSDGVKAGGVKVGGVKVGGEEEPERLAARRAALAALDEVHDVAERMLASFVADIAGRPDVVWMDRPEFDEPGRPPTLRIAPLGVGGLLAARLFGRRTVVLTSATLALGGSFEPLARQWGLPPGSDQVGRRPEPGPGPEPVPRPVPEPVPGEEDDDDDEGRHSLTWTGLDVGSPFDHRRAGILYVARHLPAPGRGGLGEELLAELAGLITASGGRTLGLFSSMRAARQAAEELRERLELPILCQGDDQTAQLVSEFAADEASCLFGTLSLWQGVDVPGPSLQLVTIDRIPFPRPDDPLASARQRAVAARGGNGFMAVAAAQAALLLAQGAGRLLRTLTDRGMVAVLDPRLSTARYADFLRASLPPFWTTTDPEIARGALRRLAAARDAKP